MECQLITGHCPALGIHVTGTLAGLTAPGVLRGELSVDQVETLDLTLLEDHGAGMQRILDTVTLSLETVFTSTRVTPRLSASKAMINDLGANACKFLTHNFKLLKQQRSSSVFLSLFLYKIIYKIIIIIIKL